MKKWIVLLLSLMVGLPSVSFGQMEKLKEKLMEALKNKAAETEQTEKKDSAGKEENKGYAKLLEGFSTLPGIFKVHT